jgi:aryl-alcohol dehydrogenase-like predicted oxidoreductase
MVTSVAPTNLHTRELGRTRRQVTTYGLGGQGALMLTPEGVDPIAIIEKAFRLGVNYFDTSNAYGPSQSNYGTAFHRLRLVPGEPNYDLRARQHIYLATKTHMRTTRHPAGEQWRNDYSDGMKDGVATAVDDVRRSLSLIFGDGKGEYPEGAYLDCIQIHNLTAQDDVDMIYERLDAPSPDAPWLGALVGLLDLREGTNRSGANPKHERLVRHIGITGHWNAAAHIYAIQRDTHRVLDTLLVAINPTDNNFFCHQHNSIPVARAAGMGVIAMKVFTDAAYFGEPATFMRDPTNVYRKVGSDQLPSNLLIQYVLSIPGVTTCLTGIGQLDSSDDPAKDQLIANINAAQLEEPLPAEKLAEIETLVVQAGLGNMNNYFQRPFIGLTPPRNVGAETDPAGFSPATPNLRPAVRVTWDTAYAGRYPIKRYEILRNGELIGVVPHSAQWMAGRFVFEDTFGDHVAGIYPPASREGVGRYDELCEQAEGTVQQWSRWTLQQSPSSDTSKVHEVGVHVYVVRAVDSSDSKAECPPLALTL